MSKNKTSFASALKQKYSAFKEDCLNSLKPKKSNYSKKELAKIKNKMKKTSMGTRG